MEPVDTGPIFAEIGRLTGEATGGDPNGAFLYAEVEPGVVTASIYLDIGNSLVYRYPTDELVDRLDEAWYALDPNKRWATLCYTITGDRFSAQFQFPEELNPQEDHEDRRARILKERYGDKPIDYSDPKPR